MSSKWNPKTALVKGLLTLHPMMQFYFDATWIIMLYQTKIVKSTSKHSIVTFHGIWSVNKETWSQLKIKYAPSNRPVTRNNL